MRERTTGGVEREREEGHEDGTDDNGKMSRPRRQIRSRQLVECRADNFQQNGTPYATSLHPPAPHSRHRSHAAMASARNHKGLNLHPLHTSYSPPSRPTRCSIHRWQIATRSPITATRIPTLHGGYSCGKASTPHTTYSMMYPPVPPTAAPARNAERRPSMAVNRRRRRRQGGYRGRSRQGKEQGGWMAMSVGLHLARAREGRCSWNQGDPRAWRVGCAKQA